MERQKLYQILGWTAAVLLLVLYVFSLYQRGNSWRLAPDIRIVVVSEPLGTITREIAGGVADVQVVPFELTGTGDRMRAEQLFRDAHVLVVPRVADTEWLPPYEARLLTVGEAFPESFQYPVLASNKQFFTYASPELQVRLIETIRDKLVDMDVVRAGKYEVAAKNLRDRLKVQGTLSPGAY